MRTKNDMLASDSDDSADADNLLARLNRSGDTWTSKAPASMSGDIVASDGLYSHRDIGLSEYLAGRWLRDRMARELDWEGEYDGSGTLTESQGHAATLVCSQPVSVLTGGPGTGKTTTLRTVVEILSHRYAPGEILLCAPTGAAAKRMAMSTGRFASTIHRLLGFTGEAFTVFRLPCEVCIIDESSMLDANLLYALLSRLPETCRVIFVGDADQLPSVGPGNVLQDLVESVPTARLTELMRSDPDGPIGMACNDILQGITPESWSGTVKDLRHDPRGFIMRPGHEQVNETVQQMSQLLGVPIYSIRNMCPFNDECNILNESMPKIGIKVPIVNRKNRKGRSGQFTMNGEVGFSYSVNGIVRFDSDTMWRDQYMHLAYWTTVHVMQGNESVCGVVYIPDRGEKFLTRRLLYTAVSRYKQVCVVKGSIENFCAGVFRQESRRVTLLPEFIKRSRAIEV